MRQRTILLIALPAVFVSPVPGCRNPGAVRSEDANARLNIDLAWAMGHFKRLHLYFAGFGRAPTPYLDFRFEYPVLTGLFVWMLAEVVTKRWEMSE